jgi:hypothetical protein
VDLVAVDLHDELELRPVEVDLVSAHEAVAGWLRQPMLAEETPEVALEPRSRRCRGGHEFREPPGRPLLHVLEPHELAHERLGERGVQGIEGERLGEVEERAEGRGDRDPPVDRHILGRQVARAVDDEARPAARLRSDRPHRPTPRARHDPEPRRALARQRAGGAGEQHHRHLAAARTDRPMAHRVHPAVKGDQCAGRDQVIDLVTRETRPQQLPPGHDPVLRTRNSRRHGTWSHFAGYRPVKRLHPATLAPAA